MAKCDEGSICSSNLCLVDHTKPFWAEVLGTFLLVLVGPGAAIADQVWELGLGNLGIAGAFGLIVFLVILLLGNVSGAHINPVVTLAFLVKGNISLSRAMWYLVAQMAGALLACLVFTACFEPPQIIAGCTLPLSNLILVSGVEVLFTYILVLTIMLGVFGLELSLPKLAFLVGLAVFIGAALAGPISGGSMNPARTLGPAVAAGRYDSFLIYIIGPIVGTLMAVSTSRIVSPYLRRKSTQKEH